MGQRHRRVQSDLCPSGGVLLGRVVDSFRPDSLLDFFPDAVMVSVLKMSYIMGSHTP